MRRGWWALGLLMAGCWRANPAFLVGLDEQSSGEVGGESTGEPGMSSGSDASGAADTTHGGGVSTDAGTTATEPSTTTADPSTTSTTGEPGSSTSGEETTGGQVSEPELCMMALAGLANTAEPLLDMSKTPCGEWTGSDTMNPGMTVSIDCGVAQKVPKGFAFAQPGIAVNPNTMFGPSLITGTQSLPTASGTIEGVFSGIDLAGAAHPCFLTTVACPKGQMSPCSLVIQVFVKSSQSGDWGTPVIETTITDMSPADIALALADFKGQPIDLLVIAQNDGLGSPQEVAAWETPRVVDVQP